MSYRIELCQPVLPRFGISNGLIPRSQHAIRSRISPRGHNRVPRVPARAAHTMSDCFGFRATPRTLLSALFPRVAKGSPRQPAEQSSLTHRRLSPRASTKAIYRNHCSNRYEFKLASSRGLFTLVKHFVADDSPIDRTPFDDLLRASFEKYRVRAPGPWFHRVTLPRVQANQLAFDLDLEGINRATLFPDFYGVVGTIKDSAKWQKDGRGAKRAKERLESVVIRYQRQVTL
jgi:hypothetical protein